MNPIWLLLIGMVVVIGGVLALRLHAFLALVLGALVVAILTPRESTYLHALRPQAMMVKNWSADRSHVTINTGKRTVPVGAPLVLHSPSQQELGLARLR